VLDSLSRLMPEVIGDDHAHAAVVLRQLLSAYRDHEDLVSIGAYRRGSNPMVDVAIEMQEEINAYLQKPAEQRSTLEEAYAGLLQLGQQAAGRLSAAQSAPAAAQAAAPALA
jgi:flagellum-specific ATP synthase